MKPVPIIASYWIFRGCHQKKFICVEVKNLKRIVTRKSCSYSPSFLSTVSPDSNVLFWMGSIEIKQFECRNGRLHVRAKTPVRLKCDSIHEMCCIEGGRSLLFATKNRLMAFDTKTGNQNWSVNLNEFELKEEMLISAITTDGLHHLFVCDKNNQCVHVFSDNTGEHLGILLKKEDGDIGVPHMIGWNHKSEVLVVTHKRRIRVSW